MDYTEVIIDQRFHRHLIGKNGANSEYTSVLLSSTKKKTGTQTLLGFRVQMAAEPAVFKLNGRIKCLGENYPLTL